MKNQVSHPCIARGTIIYFLHTVMIKFQNRLSSLDLIIMLNERYLLISCNHSLSPCSCLLTFDVALIGTSKTFNKSSTLIHNHATALGWRRNNLNTALTSITGTSSLKEKRWIISLCYEVALFLNISGQRSLIRKAMQLKAVNMI